MPNPWGDTRFLKKSATKSPPRGCYQPLVGYFLGQLPEPREPEAFYSAPSVVRCCTCQRAAPTLTLAGLVSAFEFWAARTSALFECMHGGKV